jgi:outer membrane protein OmpA-like peptidoglycan-associated protein
MTWKKQLFIPIIIVCMVICGGNAAWSETGRGRLQSTKGNDKSLFDRPGKSLLFPTTAEGIIQELSVKPSIPALQKGTRGLGGIVDDEATLTKLPKVGALILFDFDSAAIKAESLPLLREFATAFQSDTLKDAVLIVAGHTDSKGSDEYNLDLSRRRADAVKKFLVSEYQIADNRLIVKPYGEHKPIESNETSEGRSKNRRVEFIRIQ